MLPAREDDTDSEEPRVLTLRGRPATASAFRRRAAVVTVADCMRLPALLGSEVIAGAAALDAAVHRASTASQTQGCLPGELRLLGRILTADAVHVAHERGAAALAAAVVSPEAAAAARVLGLPLIRLAHHVDLDVIATELTDFIVSALEESLANLGRVTSRLAAAGATDLRAESLGDALAAAVGATVIIEDVEHRVLFTTDPSAGESLRLDADFCRGLVRTGRPAWLPVDPRLADPAPRLVAPIVAACEVLGYCSAIFAEGAPDQRVVTIALEQASKLLGLALLHERVIGMSRRAACASMLVDLLDGRMSTQLLRTRAAQLDIDLGTGVIVALFEGPADQRPEAWLRHALTALGGRRDTLVDVVAGAVVAPLAGWDRPRAVRWLRGLCVACGGGAAVLGRGTELDGVPAAYAETRRVLDIVARSEAASRGAVVDVEDLGLLGVLIDSSSSGALERFWQRRLAPLREYDARERSDLCGSLVAFFEEGGLRRAARRMNLHPNSFSYRLRRAEQIGGFSLADPDDRLELQLALRCRRLLGG
ncbi:MAG: hypothetical protein E6I76_11330 [Chloroflexi bacterium]|nr:MAG: hypothetical protein E6I76_11330 [Chloroflexota bacterium]